MLTQLLLDLRDEGIELYLVRVFAAGSGRC